MVRFGIVIPNLNQSQYLKVALESLRYQDAPFNLAIMDGGSTDQFYSVCNGYLDIINYSRSFPDNGQAAAIHEGKKIVEGDILAWINADDYYFPGALEKVASQFEANPMVDVIYGDAVHVDSEGCFQSYFPAIRDYSAGELTRNCFICQPACFYRRSAYERSGGVDPNLNYTMDWDLWCKLSLSGATFKYLPEPLAAVRYYPGTKTLSGSRQRFKEIYKIEKKYGNRLVPTYFLGAYLYSLAQNAQSKTIIWLAQQIFGFKRILKNKLYSSLQKNANMTGHNLYGFHRWTSTVERRCQIHLPWYCKRVWRRLRFTVEPINCNLEVMINKIKCTFLYTHKGEIVVDVPVLKEPHRIIEIENKDRCRWKLKGFRMEMMENG
jgi:glycosyltransferase involved in cell wall biosynthesis